MGGDVLTSLPVSRMGGKSMENEAHHRARSRSRTDSFQRWLRHQQRQIDQSDTSHVLVMNLRQGQHAAAHAHLEATLGSQELCDVQLDPTWSFGFFTARDATAAQRHCDVLNGLTDQAMHAAKPASAATSSVEGSDSTVPPSSSPEFPLLLRCQRCADVTPGRNPRVYNPNTPPVPSIALKGLAADTTAEDVRAMLSSTGLPMPVTIEFLPSAAERSLETAFLTFADVNEADRACHILSAVMCDDRILRAEFRRGGNRLAGQVYCPPDALCEQFYKDLKLFKSSREQRREYRDLPTMVQTQVHLMAEVLGLRHQAQVEDANKVVVLWKATSRSPAPSPKPSGHRSTAASVSPSAEQAHQRHSLEPMGRRRSNPTNMAAAARSAASSLSRGEDFRRRAQSAPHRGRAAQAAQAARARLGGVHQNASAPSGPDSSGGWRQQGLLSASSSGAPSRSRSPHAITIPPRTTSG